MEIKQVHVISSSEGEKGGEWGREREDRRAERKEMTEETMVTRMEGQCCTART